jgi:hypothetical protein
MLLKYENNFDINLLLYMYQHCMDHHSTHRGSSWSVSYGFGLQLPVQSMPITTKVVSSNPVHGDVYSIQRYVIKFVNDSRQVGGFLRVLRFCPPIKLTATI